MLNVKIQGNIRRFTSVSVAVLSNVRSSELRGPGFRAENQLSFYCFKELGALGTFSDPAAVLTSQVVQ